MSEEAPSLEDWDPPESLFQDAPIRERMLDVVISLREPTPVKPIAARVDCDPETARDYLEWFAEMGIVVEFDGRPARYELNRSFLRWRRVQRIRQTLSEEEIVSELESARATAVAYRERFDVDHPDDVSLLDIDDIEATWGALADWQTVRERAALLDAARRGWPGRADA